MPSEYRLGLASLAAAVIAALALVSPASATPPGVLADQSAQLIQEAASTPVVRPDRTSEGFSISDGRSRLTIPARADNPIVFNWPGQPEFSVRLPSDDPRAAAALATDGTIAYIEGDSTVSLAVQGVSGGARVQTIIEDESASSTYSYEFDLPPGGELIAHPDGSVFVVDDDATILAQIDAPWARDADGQALETAYEIDGDVLTQVVEIDDSITYPVVADPLIRRWYGYQFVMSNLQVQRVQSALMQGPGSPGSPRRSPLRGSSRVPAQFRLASPPPCSHSAPLASACATGMGRALR